MSNKIPCKGTDGARIAYLDNIRRFEYKSYKADFEGNSILVSFFGGYNVFKWAISLRLDECEILKNLKLDLDQTIFKKAYPLLSEGYLYWMVREGEIYRFLKFLDTGECEINLILDKESLERLISTLDGMMEKGKDNE